MNNQPLVSIIIPTFNRAHLIGETLDSVLAQTYQNWECIVVDDGSMDDTDKVMAGYCVKDSRFQYHHRPNDRLPGGNAARNYGFELSKGEYVNWFDSDDLMLPEKIELQVEALKDIKYDYCVDKYADFYNNSIFNNEDPFLKNEILEVNLNNYLLHKVYWGTINFMGRRGILLNTTYNENLKSGQEYNFFVSLLISDKCLSAKYVNKVLTYRRIHVNSIQQTQINNKNLRLVNKFNIYWETYISFNHNLSTKQSLFLLQKATIFYQKLILTRNVIIPISLIISEIKRKIGLIAGLKIYSVISFSYIFRKGDVLGSNIINKVFNGYFK